MSDRLCHACNLLGGQRQERHAHTTRGNIAFKNLEDMETNLTRKGVDLLEATLREKYIDMRIHDAE